MDDARNAPIVSPEQAEEFFAPGYNAQTCVANSAITVDVPGVGVVPASELDSLGFLRDKACDHLAQNRALVELLFAARDLAEHDIMRPDTDSVFRHSPWCLKCQMSEQGGSIPHAHSCKTGRVFKALEELQSVACRVGAHKIPDRMDLAQRDGEQGGAQ
jgi:hypothetical protein